jgi:hypothetical protein
MSTRDQLYRLLDHIKTNIERGNYEQALSEINAMPRHIKAVEKTPLPDGLFIIGRRWFQRSYGNTYHTVEIKDVFSQKQIAYTDIEYGYGDQYKDTAHRALKKLGYDVPDSYEDFIRAPGVDFTVCDVERKRDL